MKIEGSRSATGVCECEGREGMKRGDEERGEERGKWEGKNRHIRHCQEQEIPV